MTLKDLWMLYEADKTYSGIQYAYNESILSTTKNVGR